MILLIIFQEPPGTVLAAHAPAQRGEARMAYEATDILFSRRKANGKRPTDRPLTASEINVFRNHNMVQSLYQLIEKYDLRQMALRRLHHHMESKDEVAKFEDLM